MNAITQAAPAPGEQNPKEVHTAGYAAMPERVDEIARILWPSTATTAPYDRALCALIDLHLPKSKRLDLHDFVPDMERQVELTDILNCCANLGLTSHSVSTEMGLIEPRLTPCLFVPRRSIFGRTRAPFVVLSIKSEQGKCTATCYDTGSSEIRTIGWADAEIRLSGTAHIQRKLATESEATSVFQRQATNYSWFRALLTRFSREFACIVLLSILINALSLATPLFIMLTYDRIIGVKSIDTLPMLAAGAVAGIAFEWMLRAYRGRIIAWIAARIDWLVGTHIVEKLFSLPPAYAERAAVSSQVARIKAFEAVREFFASSSFFSAIELPFVTIAFLAIGFVAGPLVLVPIFMMAPFIILFYVMRRRIAVAMRIAAKAGSMRQRFLVSSLGLIEQIDTNGLSDVWQKKHRSLTGREQSARFRLSILSNVAEAGAHALMSISAVATLTFGVFLVWNGTITAGGLVASMILVWRVLAPLYSLCTTISRVEQIRNSIRQVNQLMDIDGEDVGSRNAARLQHVRGSLEFENATIRYDAESAPILSALSFTANPGSLILVTGDSGAGKTSVLKLAQGMYKVQSGSVRLDGFDMRQLDAQNTRRRIAYVPQTPDFFSGTIAENLRVSKPDASETELWTILDEFGLAQEFRKLPDELETAIGAIRSHKTLFLLSLARGFLKDSNLILIDKLPNALMSGKEGAAFQRMVLRQHGKRTIVMVTSRADFLEIADLVVVLRRARRPVVGTPDEVRSSIFLHSTAAAA